MILIADQFISEDVKRRFERVLDSELLAADDVVDEFESEPGSRLRYQSLAS